MNRTCVDCSALKVPSEIKERFFIQMFDKNIECPLNEKNVICIYSKLIIDWNRAYELVKGSK